MRSRRTHKRTRTHPVSSHVLPTLLVILLTIYIVFSSSSLLLRPLPSAVSLSSSCNWIWMKTAFLFSPLFFAALAEEGFAYGDYMQTLTRNMHAHRLHRGHIAFEEKHLLSQTSPLFPDTPPLLPAWTLVKSSIARSQKALFPFLSLISFPLLLSYILTVKSSSPLHLPVPSVILSYSPLLSPFFLLSSSVFSSVLQLRSEELAAQCNVDSEASCRVQPSQKTRFDPLPLLSEQLSLHNGQFLHTHACVCGRVLQ